MRDGPVFAEVLDEKLREISVAEPAPAASSTTGHRRLSGNASTFANPFLIAGSFLRPAASLALTRRPSEVRRARALNPAEQSALAQLNRLGACLSSDYSARELRRAFRLLAHRYHPDRHPSSSTVEQARLAGVFSAITDHHRCLASGLQRDGFAAD
jgi:hypothetical protein